jgi:hypothetical protein
MNKFFLFLAFLLLIGVLGFSPENEYPTVTTYEMIK